MKFKPQRLSVRRPRKRIVIIIISAVVVLALATYGVLSYLYWQSYDQNSQKAAASLKTAIDGSLGSDKTTPAPSAQIDAIVTDFEKSYGTSPCTIPTIYQWQTALPQLKTSQDTCQERFLSATNTIRALKPLSEFLKDEAKADTAIGSAIEATKSPTDYTAAAKTWATLADSKDISNSVGFAPVKLKITSLTSAVSKAFTDLATATKNESKTGFDTAITELNDAYSKIDDVKSTATSVRDAYIADLIKLYQKL